MIINILLNHRSGYYIMKKETGDKGVLCSKDLHSRGWVGVTVIFTNTRTLARDPCISEASVLSDRHRSIEINGFHRETRTSDADANRSTCAILVAFPDILSHSDSHVHCQQLIGTSHLR